MISYDIFFCLLLLFHTALQTFHHVLMNSEYFFPDYWQIDGVLTKKGWQTQICSLLLNCVPHLHGPMAEIPMWDIPGGGSRSELPHNNADVVIN